MAKRKKSYRNVIYNIFIAIIIKAYLLSEGIHASLLVSFL
jgi:hypothetical protein